MKFKKREGVDSNEHKQILLISHYLLNGLKTWE